MPVTSEYVVNVHAFWFRSVQVFVHKRQKGNLQGEVFPLARLTSLASRQLKLLDLTCRKQRTQKSMLGSETFNEQFGISCFKGS